MCYIAGTLEIIINGQRAFHDIYQRSKPKEKVQKDKQ
jgi:hypothetical protein